MRIKLLIMATMKYGQPTVPGRHDNDDLSALYYAYEIRTTVSPMPPGAI